MLQGSRRMKLTDEGRILYAYAKKTLCGQTPSTRRSTTSPWVCPGPCALAPFRICSTCAGDSLSLAFIKTFQRQIRYL